MEPVNISLFIHSWVSKSTSVILYIDPVMQLSWYVFAVRDAETGEEVKQLNAN